MIQAYIFLPSTHVRFRVVRMISLVGYWSPVGRAIRLPRSQVQLTRSSTLAPSWAHRRVSIMSPEEVLVV